jgi:hypothetical protein
MAGARQFLLPFAGTWCFVYAFIQLDAMGLLKIRRDGQTLSVGWVRFVGHR